MSPSTIPEVIDEAQDLYTALTADLDISLDFPDLDLITTFELSDAVDTELLEDICPMTVEQLTSRTVEGSGVFDALMQAVTAHLAAQFEKNRITGSDYSKVYLGSVQTAMQQGIAFLLGKDRAYLENLQLQENIKLSGLQRLRAMADVELARAQIQIARFTEIRAKLDAFKARNEYALSKMSLVTGYNQVLLTAEQYEIERAQIRETTSDGDPIMGILKYEKELKKAQALLVNEQYESQRGQSRDTNSDADPIEGLIGAQRELYKRQTWAYTRDGEAKFIKMIIDTWIARKTIDEGVAVPDEIDTDKIDELVDQARANLDFTG